MVCKLIKYLNESEKILNELKKKESEKICFYENCVKCLGTTDKGQFLKNFCSVAYARQL